MGEEKSAYEQVREAMERIERGEDAGKVTLSVLEPLKRLFAGLMKVRAVVERARRLKMLHPEYAGPAVSPHLYLMLKMAEQRLRGKRGHREVYEMIAHIEADEA